jgi:hypothetical protein
MKKVALIDVCIGGHHQSYFKENAEEILRQGHTLWIFCPNPEEIKQKLKEKIGEDVENHLKCWTLPHIGFIGKMNILKTDFEKFKFRLTLWLMCAESIRAAQIEQKSEPPDMVIFNTIDVMLSPLLMAKIADAIFPYKWAGIYVQPYLDTLLHTWRNNIDILRIDCVFRSKNAVAIMSVDETASPFIEKRYKKSVLNFPDITDETLPQMNLPIVQQIISNAAGRKIIGVFGNLAVGKGIKQLYSVSESMDKEKFFFLFAGPPEPEMIEIQQKAEKSKTTNIFFLLNRISDGEYFNSLVNVCDIVYINYATKQSSNILTKAVMLKKKFIVSKGGLNERRMKKYGLGIAVEYDNVEEIKNAILKISYSEDEHKKVGYDTYFSNHNKIRLEKVIAEILK